MVSYIDSARSLSHVSDNMQNLRIVPVAFEVERAGSSHIFDSCMWQLYVQLSLALEKRGKDSTLKT
jgi:hypothetical protein